MTGQREDAEDAVQEAVVRAFSAFDSWQPDTNFRAWFLRILVNVCFNRHRTKTRRPVETDWPEENAEGYLWEQTRHAGMHGQSFLGFATGQKEDPAALLLDRLDADQIARALSTLPPDFQAVAALYFSEEMSYQEIAALLEIPIGTVRSRLHRSRKLLQRELWPLACERGLIDADS